MQISIRERLEISADLRHVGKDIPHLALVDAIYRAERTVQLLLRRLRRVISCVAADEIRESREQSGIILLRSAVYHLLWSS